MPLTWWRQRPVYLAGILALIAAGSMVLTAIIGVELIQNLVFTHDGFFKHLRIWTPITWPMVNFPSVWVLLGCFIFWRFGEAVERHLGRRVFVKMLLLLLLVSPALISVLGMLGQRGLACVGFMQIEFAVFVAFATLYPRAQFNILVTTIDAWVLAAIFVGISALSCLAGRNWAELLLLAANVGTAWLVVRYETGNLSLPQMPQMPSRPQAAPKPAKTPTPDSKPSTSPEPTVDDILDKISASGMHSLTAEERRILDAASQDMQKRKR
ncbi:MAG: hypothetical protein IPK32_07800 [Verrucomicrobiaceae bacterium]|nr:hypothetical protein [Verrucomicrobiaceae bacterium]